MNVIIMRGIPGSGKTTYMKKSFAPTSERLTESVSADEFFVALGGGTYKFVLGLLKDAHAKCLQSFIHRIQHSSPETNMLVVDNTNIRTTEIAPYYAIAESYGHEAKIITLDVHPAIAFKRNAHNVPWEQVMSMHQTMKIETTRFPPWWKHEVVIL